LPPAWTFQWLYLLYRWILALYFGGWLLYYSIKPGVAKGDKFLIYLTNWGFLFWVAYLISAAVAVTVNFIRAWACNHVLYFPRRDSPTRQLMAERDDDDDDESDTTANCCHRTPDSTNFCDKITWCLFLVGAEAAVLIALLFWTTLYNTPGAATPLSVHLHLVNAVVAILDLWVSGVPIFLLQFIYIQIFGVTYVSFTGMYYAFGNTSVIYPVLDYQANPGLAAGLAVGMAVFGTVMVHLIFLAQYLCRRYATSRLLLKYKKKYRLSFSASSAVHIVTRENSDSPPPSSSSSSGSSLCSDTTPILYNKKSKQHSTTYSSRESFF
jgi:hypothetical protein